MAEAVEYFSSSSPSCSLSLSTVLPLMLSANKVPEMVAFTEFRFSMSARGLMSLLFIVRLSATKVLITANPAFKLAIKELE